MNFEFAQAPATILSLCAMTILSAGSQLSVAEATPVADELEFASQFIVRSAGQTITGFVVSCVVINCTQELIFKHESVAVHMR